MALPISMVDVAWPIILNNGLNNPKMEWGIYPNPAREYIYIETSANWYKASLLNLNGKTLVSTTTMGRLSTSEIPEGVYLVKLENEQGRSTYKKVLIQ